jgi:hypothetical protein
VVRAADVALRAADPDLGRAAQGLLLSMAGVLIPDTADLLAARLPSSEVLPFALPVLP